MLLIARRYLLSEKSHSVVNIIAMVSLVALFVPVAAVIVLLSVFNGFGQMVEDLSGAIDGDLTVRLYEGRLFEVDSLDSHRLRGIEGVEAVSFITDYTMLLEQGGRSSVVTVRGVDDEYRRVVPIDDFISVGEFDCDRGIVMGNSLASKLGIRALRNSSVTMYSLKRGLSGVGGVLQGIVPTANYTDREIDLVGVLWLDQESEERYAFTSREVVYEMIGREGVATRVAVKLAMGSDVERVRDDISSVVGDKFRVESLAELNPAIYQIVKYEKRGITLICGFVMLLASFTLIGALAMLIIEKRGDIATLRAIGMTRREVKRVFMMEGVLISLVATFAGVVVGVMVTLAQEVFGFVKLPSSSMVVTHYPVELQWGDVAVVVVMATSISLLLCWLVVRNMLTKKIM